jgi:peptidyl-tRNA hydrolase
MKSEDEGSIPSPRAYRTHYVIVRRDLPQIGTIAAQIVHAAGESSPGDLDEGTHAVVLQTPDEQGLLELEKSLLQADIRHVAVREPDAPWHGALMSIGIDPTHTREEVRPHTKHLKLLKGLVTRESTIDLSWKA